MCKTLNECKTPHFSLSIKRGKCVDIPDLMPGMVEDKQQPDKAASEKKIADNKKKKQKAEEDKDADLSEEDLELKNNLILMVTRIGEGNPGVQKLALQQIANEIRSATTSMTSVPKPLKFLRAHYQTLVDVHGQDIRRRCEAAAGRCAISFGNHHWQGGRTSVPEVQAAWLQGKKIYSNLWISYQASAILKLDDVFWTCRRISGKHAYSSNAAFTSSMAHGPPTDSIM